MAVNTKTTDQEAKENGLLSRLNNLSLRSKIIGIAVLVFLVLLIIAIPGDRNELIARQERVEAAQVAYDLVFPAVGPMMENVTASLDDTELDLSANRSYTGLSTSLNTFNRANTVTASQFQAVLTFHRNIHALQNDVPELETPEFSELVTEMDTTLGVAWLALMEMNTAIDEYNGYHNWISAGLAGALFDLPQGYVDPISSNSSLNRNTALEMEQ